MKDATAMNQLLREIYSQDHLFLSYNMKKSAPKAIATAIVKQNKLIAETFVIVITGISRDIMPSLQVTLNEEIPGIRGISDTHRTDQTRQWFVLVKESAFLKTCKTITGHLHTWLSSYPETLHDLTPNDFPHRKCVKDTRTATMRAPVTLLVSCLALRLF